MLKLDLKTYDSIHESDKYKEADQEFVKTLSTLQRNEQMKIEEAVTFLETVVLDLTYQKAFRDGMRFILNALAGKDSFEIADASGSGEGVRDHHSTVDKYIIDIETSIMKAHASLVELEEVIEHHNKEE